MRVLARRWITVLLPLLISKTTLAQDPIPTPRALPSPTLVIGKEGEPDYEFLRIWTAVRGTSGNVAVVDASQTIRVYAPTGQLLRKLGRNGEGPGEFRRISELFLVADTLVAFDNALRRLTWYSIGGSLLRSVRFRPSSDHGSLRIAGRLSDNQWVVETSHSPGWEHGSGTYRDTTHVGIVRATATGPVHWLGEFPGMTFFVYTPADRRPDWRVGMLPQSPLPIIATWRDSVIVGNLGTAELTYYAASGRKARTLQLPVLVPRRNLSTARTEAIAAERVEAAKTYVNLAYDAAEKAPPRLWDHFVVADNGDLWIALADADPTVGQRYLVVNPRGGILATWLLPPRSRLLSVSGRTLLIAMRDANDVERIAVYQL